MPKHILPIARVDRENPGFLLRVQDPIGPGLLITDKGFYRIAMSHDGAACWSLNSIPTTSVGCVIGANSSQVIYVPESGVNSLFVVMLPNPTNPTGVLSINKLEVWEMPGNTPGIYDLYPPTP